jgi:hypothetical protein
MPISITVRATPGGVGKLLSRVRILGKDDVLERVDAVGKRIRDSRELPGLTPVPLDEVRKALDATSPSPAVIP